MPRDPATAAQMAAMIHMVGRKTSGEWVALLLRGAWVILVPPDRAAGGEGVRVDCLSSALLLVSGPVRDSRSRFLGGSDPSGW